MSPGPTRHASLGKLSPPRLGRVFERRRLYPELDAWRHAPGLWLAAPPGSGKTTLVATWLRPRAAAEAVLWMRLDADDADPATFAASFDLLLSSLVQHDPGLAPFGADDAPDLPGWLRRRLRRLLPMLPPRWVLVFDNQQELPAASPLHGALAGLLPELPDGVQWIFTSRTMPPPSFARMLATQALGLIGPEALRFDADETRELVRLHGHDDTMVEPLAAAEGWAAGMTLMLIGTPRDAGRRPTDAARERLFDYFAGEVLAGMSTEEQRTLAALAWLPSITAELAVAMSDSAAAPTLLERLATASLFTDRRGDVPATYAFHALFADFLRRRAAQTLAAAELNALLLRAGRLLLAAGQTDSGLQLLCDSQAWAEAEDSLRRLAPGYVAEGRFVTLARLLDRLPAGHAQQLAYWRGCCRLPVDPLSAVADMTLAWQQAVDRGCVHGQLEAASGAAAALVISGRAVELDRWIDVFTEHAGTALGADAASLRLVPGFFAAVTHRQPWHPRADELADRAEALLHQGADAGQRLLLGAFAFHYLWRGQLDRLDRLIRHIDALCAEGEASPVSRVHWWSVGIVVKTLIGRLESADADARSAVALAEAEPALQGQRAYAQLVGVLTALCERDAGKVRRMLARAAELMPLGSPLERGFYEQERALLALLEGDAPTALALMGDAVDSTRRSGFAVREHVTLIGHALAATVCGRHDLALDSLQRAQGHPIWPVCRWHQWLGGCIAAYAALQRGDRPQACAQLRQAFAVAQANGYSYGPTLFIHAPLMPALAALALQEGIETGLATTLVLTHRLAPPPGAGDEWPWPVRVHVFGRLQMWIDGAALPAPRKESRRLLELLGLLAAHGHEPLGLDEAADALWPDSDGDAARNALDNAVHRLRKLLRGDDCVLLRQGALVLNPQRCWIDAAAIGPLLSRLEHGCHPTDGTEPVADGIVEAAARLRRLYRAPMLPGDERPAIAQRRLQLHRRVQHAFVRARQALEALGRADAAARIGTLQAGLDTPVDPT